jgi:Protein kinase domain
MLSEAAPPSPTKNPPRRSLSPRAISKSSSSPHGSPKLGRVSRKSRSIHHGSGSSSRSARNRVSIKFTAQTFVKNRSLGEELEHFYDLGDKIGEGGFGEVFTVIHKKTGAERAVKVIYKSEDSDIDFEMVNTTIKNEFNVVKSLDHPNLLKQYEMFEDDEKFMIVTGRFCTVYQKLFIIYVINSTIPLSNACRHLQRRRIAG